ncbi:MBL fold metallo-hydrolase [Halorubellus sp. PRR65]|uniref:MBL fold metallo-hydrolase n=1 Tax=Halorubellus sp. PRR65 TaxID=3098148 RepID=UPI002B25DE8C|nr:MBL fold metallo-hydrolase [Halorubellus sp. PRR65]
MEVRFQRANHRTGNESVLLKFEGVLDEQTACVLVDSGRGVDVSAQMGDDEHLAGVLVTHAHLDHFRSLGENAVDGAPVLAAAPTAAVLAESLSENERNDRATGDVAGALDALEPVTGWRTLLGDDAVRVHPVPAGHAPGAAGFVVEFRDDGVARRLLVTGDFTRTQTAGYPALPDSLPVDVEAMVVNVATAEGYERRLHETLETTLGRALDGDRTLLTAGGLSGVHLARLLAAAAGRFSLDVTVRLVGQPAKLYAALDLPTDAVELTAEYADPEAVLDAGAVTIAAPETPVDGSAKRLFGAIEGDADAALVQVTTGALDPVTGGACTTDAFEVRAHPTEEVVDSVVEGYDPLHVVVAHENGPALDAYKDKYASFVWANQDAIEQTLYADGDWQAPPWVSERAEQYVYGNTETTGGTPLSDDERLDASLPAVAADDVLLHAEGIDVARLAERFGSTSTGDASVDADASEDLSTVLARLEEIESLLAARGVLEDRVPVTVEEFGDRTVLVLPEGVDVDDADDVQVFLDDD